ncbi:MAG TPA: cyclopropane-fatty-acyl-phospholipid synthase family protein [Steroidobacteraceae bacterium]|nr:cyclopropane-fatty-acyl-phospholipid synthase family protein [Steroidobacteraceae bacterium]
MNAVAGSRPLHGPGPMDRFLRARLLERLSGLRHARLQLCDADGTIELGSAQDPALPRVRLEVLDPAFYRLVAAGGSVGAGEAYMEGFWRCSAPGLDSGQSLVALIRLLLRNRDLLDGLESGLARLGAAALRAWHAARRNTRAGSRRNIAAHYDIGNDFFRLFLSDDLMYSSAMWQGSGDTLEAASTRKLETICRRLQLKPSDHVIEIGTGWGGFALYAARNYGCRITTTTISREQRAFAAARVAEAGLERRIEVRLDDYRDLTGRYDKLVSIEMIEAVGAPYLTTYFAVIDRLLKADGLALLQAITIEDHRYRMALRSVDFIKRHVFPGSFIPSVSAMLAAKSRVSDLGLVALEDFGDSYARTLAAWRERFMASLPQARAQGFDERFIRLWEFYLAYCEGGFRERSVAVAHLLLAKPGWRRLESIVDREPQG